MKKSIFAVASGAVLALGLAACGAPPEAEGETAAPDSQETDGGGEGEGDAAAGDGDFTACMVSDEGGFDDASFNESGFNGLKRAESELGIEIKWAESADPSDYPSNVDSQVQAGCDLIIGVGFALNDTISESAAANPDVMYALVDDVPEEGLENARALVFNTQEAGFLAGYLAAGMSETGTVATYGGMLFPSVTIFMDGFVDGVDHYNEAKGTDVKALGWDKEQQDGSATGDFSNVENGYNTTKQFISQGADIILPVAGPVGSGSLKAASEEEGVSVIWVDADGYLQDANADTKQYILTSVMKGITQSVFDVIKDTVDGNFTSEPYVGTLENEGVGLAPFHDFEDQVSDELKSEIEDLREQIVSGELEVTSPSQN